MQKIRALVASEHPPLRKMMATLATDEPGVTVTGEAGNYLEVTTMARTLKPDMVLLDFHLPYTMGLDTVRLSRISGLDAALAIADEAPEARVILFSNLDTVSNGGAAKSAMVRLATRRNGLSTALALRKVCLEAVGGVPLFADVILMERTPRTRVAARPKRRLALNVLGALLLSLAGAWMLIGTVLFVLFLIAILA